MLPLLPFVSDLFPSSNLIIYQVVERRYTFRQHKQCSLAVKQVVCFSFVVFNSLNTKEHIQKYKTK